MLWMPCHRTPVILGFELANRRWRGPGSAEETLPEATQGDPDDDRVSATGSLDRLRCPAQHKQERHIQARLDVRANAALRTYDDVGHVRSTGQIEDEIFEVPDLDLLLRGHASEQLSRQAGRL